MVNHAPNTSFPEYLLWRDLDFQAHLLQPHQGVISFLPESLLQRDDVLLDSFGLKKR